MYRFFEYLWSVGWYVERACRSFVPTSLMLWLEPPFGSSARQTAVEPATRSPNARAIEETRGGAGIRDRLIKVFLPTVAAAYPAMNRSCAVALTIMRQPDCVNATRRNLCEGGAISVGGSSRPCSAVSSCCRYSTHIGGIYGLKIAALRLVVSYVAMVGTAYVAS